MFLSRFLLVVFHAFQPHYMEKEPCLIALRRHTLWQMCLRSRKSHYVLCNESGWRFAATHFPWCMLNSLTSAQGSCHVKCSACLNNVGLQEEKRGLAQRLSFFRLSSLLPRTFGHNWGAGTRGMPVLVVPLCPDPPPQRSAGTMEGATTD